MVVVETKPTLSFCLEDTHVSVGFWNIERIQGKILDVYGDWKSKDSLTRNNSVYHPQWWSQEFCLRGNKIPIIKLSFLARNYIKFYPTFFLRPNQK